MKTRRPPLGTPTVAVSVGRAIAVLDSGDLAFAVESASALFTCSVVLPDLRRCGVTSERRAAWYGPSPNVWGRRASISDAGSTTVLLVPRRYQWWCRFVLDVHHVDLIRTVSN
jgi:hypothetical protein